MPNQPSINQAEILLHKEFASGNFTALRAFPVAKIQEQMDSGVFCKKNLEGESIPSGKRTFVIPNIFYFVKK